MKNYAEDLEKKPPAGGRAFLSLNWEWDHSEKGKKMVKNILFQRVVKKLGGAERIHQGLREHALRADEFESMRSKLTEEFPNQWVSIYKGDVVAAGDDHKQVLEMLEAKDIPVEETVTEYLSTKPRQMIL